MKPWEVVSRLLFWKRDDKFTPSLQEGDARIVSHIDVISMEIRCTGVHKWVFLIYVQFSSYMF